MKFMTRTTGKWFQSKYIPSDGIVKSQLLIFSKVTEELRSSVSKNTADKFDITVGSFFHYLVLKCS